MHRSLKKLFIDKKIPREYRDIIPIICDDSGIIYVPFVGVADRAVLNDSTNIKNIDVLFNTIEIERWNINYEE